MLNTVCLQSCRLMLLCSGVVAVLFLAGCGSDTCVVQGKIVYEDDRTVATDLAGYTLTLESVEQKAGASGTVRPDGTFEVSTFEHGDGAVPGKHRVAITPPIQETDGPPIKSLIHSRYGSLEESGLEITVASGSNEVTLSVERAEP